MASEGLTDKEIARHLRVSITTVRTYWNRMRRKLDASNRAQAIVRALDSKPRPKKTVTDSLKNVLSSSLLGIIVVDKNGRITDTNDAFLETIGYDREEFERLGLSWPQLTVRRVGVSPETTPCVRELRHRDGHTVWVIAAALLCDTSEGAMAHYIIDLGRIPTYDSFKAASQSVG
ncbi:PAS/PAC sensor hybrid histidine kinase [Fimbriimonas ginsengisoli Gsoil 348]|uniref:PAS/PAC sensor hybrid histidine kinase n=1 Tax=Fimbriimonas ginsengisoli Gsoil 348 TaxID=661478 RepID=A0A068NIZ2_FIMGI|nr:PAS/PAC sensor hybrid histidine kinase [Fimbriimonas ginsengisoli Gsoil 348]